MVIPLKYAFETSGIFDMLRGLFDMLKLKNRSRNESGCATEQMIQIVLLLVFCIYVRCQIYTYQSKGRANHTFL